MKQVLLAAGLCMAMGAQAQINLEHSYSTNERMEVVNIDGEGYKYIGVEAASKKIMIYNADHSLWKAINTSIPQNASLYPILSYASKTLFNNDNKVEVVVMFLDLSVSPSIARVQIYNEDGITLQSFNDANGYELRKFDNNYKLLVHFSGTSNPYTNVYSVPGQYTGLKPAEERKAETGIYPNPVETAATIRYTLPAGTHTATLHIYNSTGVPVKQMQVTNQFQEVLLQRGDLVPGNYYYQLAAPGMQGVSQQFVVR